MIIDGKRVKGFEIRKHKEQYIYVWRCSAWVYTVEGNNALMLETYDVLTDDCIFPSLHSSASDNWLNENTKLMTWRQCSDELKQKVREYLTS